MDILRVLVALGLIAAAGWAAQPEYFVYVGTYTGPKSKGIYAWRFDPAGGKLTEIGPVGETKNPSFVAFHPSGKFLYAVNETRDGSLTAFSLDPKTGKLTRLNSAPSKGADPCFLTVDRTGGTLLAANYSSGTVVGVKIGSDGQLGASTAFDQHKGSGGDKARQGEPHAHSIVLSPDQRFALVADLGTDQIFVYRFDPAKGTLTPNQPPTASTAPAAGPRHIAFHPDGRHVYVINELNSTISAYSWDAKAGVLHPVGSVSSLPAGFKGENSTAEVVVHPNGKFVYGSNRGHNSIAVFRVDPATGKLTLVEHVATQGKTPRNFALDPTGTYLFAANQDTDNVVVFRVDQASGKLTPTGQQMKVGSPVCVRFLPAGS
jgi:6-phosphogluconolactonase